VCCDGGRVGVGLIKVVHILLVAFEQIEAQAASLLARALCISLHCRKEIVEPLRLDGHGHEHHDRSGHCVTWMTQWCSAIRQGAAGSERQGCEPHSLGRREMIPKRKETRVRAPCRVGL
jgi:hypothetical protein